MKNELAVRGTLLPEFRSILSTDALDFIEKLERSFGKRRQELLARRSFVQARLDKGEPPDFLSEGESTRKMEWQAPSPPKDLLDRRVEITGPVDRKMVINALNSGAKVYMADFEDSHSPTWEGTIRGQINLYDAVRRTIGYQAPDGKKYELKANTAVLMVRPRGWHLEERHITIDERPVSASLFDFGLYYFHNAKELIKRGTGPYFYLPKLENHLEARLWNDVFNYAEDFLQLARGSIRATVLIETILAAFEMDEILHELKEHSAGLNCGRWDYIFSFIKKFRNQSDYLLPDRHQVTMTSHFLKSYTELVIQTCHRRGVHAMGGMAAQIPIKEDAKRNAGALEQVRADKLREVQAGHDGTWVAHPALVGVAMEIFDAHMPGSNQLHNLRADVRVTAMDLLRVPSGSITENGLRNNISVGVQYLEAWLRGNGCVAINHLMEDAATAEIARAQLWQWIRHSATQVNGQKIDLSLFRKLLADELAVIRRRMGDADFHGGRFENAAALFDRLTTSPDFIEFLTIPAYEYIIEKGALSETTIHSGDRKRMEQLAAMEKH